jgi:hypothetical protein
MELSQEYLHKLFEYKDGVLYWKEKPSKFANIKVGSPAGRTDSHGYFQTTINKRGYLNHRLIFFMHHGYLPKVLDHIDGNRKNNLIDNLREATVFQNNQNRAKLPNNKSGYKNVYFHKDSNKWAVTLRIDGKETHIGLFDDLELADLVATEARDKFHKQYARHI